MMKLTRRQAMCGAAALAAGLGHRIDFAHAVEIDSIDRVLRDAVDARRVPGVVALAAQSSGEVYAGAFGARDLVRGNAMTLDSVFWIASMTKAVTTTAAMQMVEAGKLSLDAPASDIVRELQSPQVLEGFDEAGAPRLRPAKRPVTLRQLLTHTAGYTYDIWNADTGRYEKYANLPGIITCKNAALETPLAFDPGDRWEYGTNIDWAGKMVEKVSGQRLEEYFRDRIFGPLGMSDTGFRLGASQRARLVAMHAREADGSLKPIDFEMPQDPEFYMGGGGLYSTGPDYLKFVRMFLHEGNFNGAQVLRPETVAEMTRNQIGDLNVVMLKTVQPGSSLDAEFFPGMVKKWGLGFMINAEEAPTGRSAGSLAWAGLANTYFWIDPKKDVAGVILMQLLPFADPQALQSFAAFETAVYDRVAMAAPGVGSSTPPVSK
jgi:CubicO group peptidase (beta-lactamase class C family)